LLLQVVNAHVQDQLHATQQQQHPNIVDAQALKKCLEDIKEALSAYRVTHYYMTSVMWSQTGV